MPKNLLIVESPAKAKTIEKYLGKDFVVKSSFGHVRDLAKKSTAVEIENNFKPNYEVSPDKKKVVKDLKDWVKKVDEVWLATDEDREGEAISWHLCKVLGLDELTTKRIVFREITKPAIQQAVQKPRLVDLNLVNAQQARRILDRLVGFELSGLLWKKVKGKLSAGRVQSVAVRLIVDKERDIQGFETTPFYKVTAVFDVKDKNGKTVGLNAELPTRYDSEADAQAFLDQCLNADFKIEDIQVRPGKRRPSAPFTTSTLQQEASRKLGYSVKRTMVVAQKLYEAGSITYMRTDSVSLSETALEAIATEIQTEFGEKYLKTRRYKGKNSNSQEAHEAIRPTYIERQSVSPDRDEQRLYELIWKRTIASQMADAELEKTTVKIGISTIPDARLTAAGEVMKFDGFLKVYIESKDDDGEDEAKGILPPLKENQILDLNEMRATEKFTRPPARYTEASLVSKLEELGIGRPSTYAPTISKIMEENRGYVIKDSKEGEERNYTIIKLKDQKVTKKVDTERTGVIKNRLFATDLGMVVTDFLKDNFDEIMEYSFTAGIEQKFDRIADGKQEWENMLGEFYPTFHETVQETLEKSGRATGERILGKDPESGRTILVRMSRYGTALVQIGSREELEEDEKPKYANLSPGLSLGTITLEEALKCFQLPRDLGTYEGKELSIGSGRFGPYVKHDEKFISIPRGEDAIAMTKERAIELVEEKKKADAPVGTYKGIPFTKGKGRFGPFLKWDKFFVNVPKRYDFENLSLDDAYELIEKKIVKEANRYIHQWEDLGISVENGRWGPYVKFKKKNINIPKVDGKRVTSEEAKEFTLEQVKEIIVAEIPDAFEKKTRAKAKPKAKAKAKKK